MNLDNSFTFGIMLTLSLAITMGYAHAIAGSVGIYNNLFNVKGSPEPILGIRLSWLALSFCV